MNRHRHKGPRKIFPFLLSIFMIRVLVKKRKRFERILVRIVRMGRSFLSCCKGWWCRRDGGWRLLISCRLRSRIVLLCFQTFIPGFLSLLAFFCFALPSWVLVRSLFCFWRISGICPDNMLVNIRIGCKIFASFLCIFYNLIFLKFA